MKQLLIIISLLLIITSCSKNNEVISGRFIQKRKYNKGFFVKTKSKENNKKSIRNFNDDKGVLTNKIDLKEIKNEDFNYVESDYNTENNIVASNVINEDLESSLNLITDESMVKENPLLAALINRHELKRNKEKIALNGFDKNDVKNKEDEKPYYIRNEPLAIIGFGVGLWGALIAFGSPLVGMITCFIFGSVAILFALLSLRKRKKNPERYKGKSWVWWSIAMGALCFIKAFILMAQI